MCVGFMYVCVCVYVVHMWGCTCRCVYVERYMDMWGMCMC